MALKKFAQVQQGGFLPRRIVRTGYVESIPMGIPHMEKPHEGLNDNSVVDLLPEPRRITVLEYGPDPKAPAIEVQITVPR